MDFKAFLQINLNKFSAHGKVKHWTWIYFSHEFNLTKAPVLKIDRDQTIVPTDYLVSVDASARTSRVRAVVSHRYKDQQKTWASGRHRHADRRYSKV